MPLAIVHKEKVRIKEEPKSFENEPNFGKETEVYRCELYVSSFETQLILDEHNTSCHKEDKRFNCEICDYSFSQKGSLKLHIASIHEGKKPFKCDICDYSCSRKSSETTIPESTNS